MLNEHDNISKKMNDPDYKVESLRILTSIMNGTFVESKKTTPPTTIPGPELKQEYGRVTPEKNL